MGQNRLGTTGLDDMKHNIIKCKTTTFIRSIVKYRVGLLYKSTETAIGVQR